MTDERVNEVRQVENYDQLFGAGKGAFMWTKKADDPEWKGVLLACPKCGDPLSLSGHTIEQVDPLTVSPSVLHVGECGAHFFIRGGRVEWA